jgi:hypothetical protein
MQFLKSSLFFLLEEKTGRNIAKGKGHPLDIGGS